MQTPGVLDRGHWPLNLVESATGNPPLHSPLQQHQQTHPLQATARPYLGEQKQARTIHCIWDLAKWWVLTTGPSVSYFILCFSFQSLTLDVLYSTTNKCELAMLSDFSPAPRISFLSSNIILQLQFFHAQIHHFIFIYTEIFLSLYCPLTESLNALIIPKLFQHNDTEWAYINISCLWGIFHTGLYPPNTGAEIALGPDPFCTSPT